MGRGKAPALAVGEEPSPQFGSLWSGLHPWEDRRG